MYLLYGSKSTTFHLQTSVAVLLFLSFCTSSVWEKRPPPSAISYLSPPPPFFFSLSPPFSSPSHARSTTKWPPPMPLLALYSTSIFLALRRLWYPRGIYYIEPCSARDLESKRPPWKIAFPPPSFPPPPRVKFRRCC